MQGSHQLLVIGLKAGTKSETRLEAEIPNLRSNARPFGKFRVFVIISLKRPMSMKYTI